MVDDLENALKPGTEFDGYRIEAVLGAGGFGITYKALEPLLDRHVAVKEYMPSGMATRGSDGAEVRPLSGGHAEDFNWGLERFRTEAQTLVSFRHPNIVQVHRYFEANNTGYLVMDFVNGPTLSHHLMPDRTLPEDELRGFLDKLLDGLSAVHARGFLHRDIKPANVILEEDGAGGRQPVLIDFGAARLAIGQYSKSLTAIVSEGFAPYEQYDSSGEQGAWTDIYALGGVIYRSVTGERPPDSPSRISALVRGRDDPMTPAAKAAKGDYSPELLGAIDAALAVREDDRPQTIEAFRALLAGAAEPETEAAAAPTRPSASKTVIDGADETRFADPAPEGNETLFAGAAPDASARAEPVAAASAASPEFPEPLAPRTPTPATASSKGRSSSRRGLVYAGVAVAAVAVGGGIWATMGGDGGGASPGMTPTPSTAAPAPQSTSRKEGRLIAGAPKILWRQPISPTDGLVPERLIRVRYGRLAVVGPGNEAGSSSRAPSKLWIYEKEGKPPTKFLLPGNGLKHPGIAIDDDKRRLWFLGFRKEKPGAQSQIPLVSLQAQLPEVPGGQVKASPEFSALSGTLFTSVQDAHRFLKGNRAGTWLLAASDTKGALLRIVPGNTIHRLPLPARSILLGMRIAPTDENSPHSAVVLGNVSQRVSGKQFQFRLFALRVLEYQDPEAPLFFNGYKSVILSTLVLVTGQTHWAFVRTRNDLQSSREGWTSRVVVLENGKFGRSFELENGGNTVILDAQPFYSSGAHVLAVGVQLERAGGKIRTAQPIIIAFDRNGRSLWRKTYHAGKIAAFHSVAVSWDSSSIYVLEERHEQQSSEIKKSFSILRFGYDN